MRTVPPGQARARIVLLSVLATVSMALAFACSGKVVQAGGLFVKIDTNLDQPKDFDGYSILVEQEKTDGSWHTQFDNPNYPTSAKPLPTSLSIAAGPSSDQNARITVTATLGGTPVVTSVAQVLVPTDRVLELDIFLAQSCVGVTCTSASQACKDKVGCQSIVVKPSDLQPYQPGGQAGGSSGSVNGSSGGSVDGTTDMPDATIGHGDAGGGGSSGGMTCSPGCNGCCDPKAGCVSPGSACPSGGMCNGGAGAPCTTSGGTCSGATCAGCCDSNGICVGLGAPCSGGLICNGGGGVACSPGGGCGPTAQSMCVAHGGCYSPASCTCSPPCPSGMTCTANGCSDGTITDSGSCGAQGQSCCGGVCNSGYVCDVTNTCSNATACGQIGQSCCQGGTCNVSMSTCGAANTCVACGLAGQPCCSGGVAGPGGCRSGGAGGQSYCGPSNTCVACGQQNQACCGITDAGSGGYCNPGSGGQNLVCASGKCQIQCGTSVGAPCCGNTCSGMNLMCSGGSCVSCGAPGQTCCPYNSCFNQSNGTFGCCVSNVCIGSGQGCPASIGGGICGGMPPQSGCVQPDGGNCGSDNCCTGNVCTWQNTTCDTASHKCTGCGYAGSSACPDGTCNGGSINQNGTCVSCGGLYQACCSSSTACNSSYYCDGGVCL